MLPMINNYMDNLKFEVVSFNQSNNSEIIDILQDIIIYEVPTEYIQLIRIKYDNGKIMVLEGEEISSPLPIGRSISEKNVMEAFEGVDTIRIYIDTDLIELDIGRKTNDLLNDITPF